MHFIISNNAKIERLVCCGLIVLTRTSNVDLKKSYTADLEHRRVSAFLLGVVCVLSMFFIALEYTTQSAEQDGDNDVIADMSQDIEMMPALQRNDMIAAAPAQHSAAMAERFTPVEKAVSETTTDIQGDNEASSTQQGAAEQGMGAASSTEETAQRTTALSPVAIDENDNPLNFQVVERLPEFPGGIVEFMKWLTKTLRYPTLAQTQKVQGKVIVAFIINKDGTISGQKVVKSVSPELDREALRVLRIMPKWKPGEDHGKPCRTYFCIPIVFKL